MERVDYQITLCSGSNLTHGSIASIGHHCPNAKINVLCRRPAEFSKNVIGTTDRTIWKYKGQLSAEIQRVSDDPADVIPGSKMVIICSPINIIPEFLQRIKEHLDPETIVGTVFGSGAFDLQAFYYLGDLIKKFDLTIFGLQFVPFLCKTTEYGKSVEIYGPKSYLCCAAYPATRTDKVSNMIALLYATPTVPIPNFLCLTLTPSNQIIHPGRVYGYFKDWDGKKGFVKSELPSLYSGLDDASAEAIQLLDDEIQAIKTAIVTKWPQIDMTALHPIKKRISYNYKDSISDFSTLKSVFNTNDGYAKNVFPTVPHADGKHVVLNTNSRFFNEDIPYGLCVLKNIGDLLKVDMPNAEKMIRWHQKFMPYDFIDKEGNFIEENIEKTGIPLKYGVKSPYQLVKSALPDLFSTSKM
jgi:opine dehydrogenase